MKKLIAIACSVIIIILGLVACDENSDGPRVQDNGATRTKIGIVIMVNDAFNPNYIKTIDTDNGWRIGVLSDTNIEKQRPSCSGFSSARIVDIDLGDTIEWEFNPETVEYVGTPNHVEAVRIVVWHQDCIQAVEYDCYCCPTNCP